MQRAALCLVILTALGSGGCAGHGAPQGTVAAPVVIWPAPCARPAMPALPRMSGLAFLESRQGYELLRLRDRRLRAYVAGLEDALDCYEAQLQPMPLAEKEGVKP